jgi:hypothetical protein
MEKRKERRRRAACTEEKKDERGIYFLFIFCGFQDPDSTLLCKNVQFKELIDVRTHSTTVTVMMSSEHLSCFCHKAQINTSFSKQSICSSDQKF